MKDPQDPAAVAEKIFECAVRETPIHNYAGLDCEAIVGMRTTLPDHEFLAAMREKTMPPSS